MWIGGVFQKKNWNVVNKFLNYKIIEISKMYMMVFKIYYLKYNTVIN